MSAWTASSAPGFRKGHSPVRPAAAFVDKAHPRGAHEGRLLEHHLELAGLNVAMVTAQLDNALLTEVAAVGQHLSAVTVSTGCAPGRAQSSDLHGATGGAPLPAVARQGHAGERGGVAVPERAQSYDVLVELFYDFIQLRQIQFAPVT
ncbi:hypothetical protein AB0B67_29605 [Streptomyces spectabilis]|uniref:Uncharacterized protein n=1 Tax=Streptomyces spectabilis TaxID=68270 RepID=A0A5P2XHS6_STRST|nr:hypothetical protein [Streptomyces spectabilis]MBB5104942.1 hypothetical protein [Streptomyces spectabilis]MCI3905675.1 hypothetical protein [Streptomyces spectabilis]QEV62635.1 hypothetical protein CP982_31180 [Streptomyces spectabilis]